MDPTPAALAMAPTPYEVAVQQDLLQQMLAAVDMDLARDEVTRSHERCYLCTYTGQQTTDHDLIYSTAAIRTVRRLSSGSRTSANIFPTPYGASYATPVGCHRLIAPASGTAATSPTLCSSWSPR